MPGCHGPWDSLPAPWRGSFLCLLDARSPSSSLPHSPNSVGKLRRQAVGREREMAPGFSSFHLGDRTSCAPVPQFIQQLGTNAEGPWALPSLPWPLSFAPTPTSPPQGLRAPPLGWRDRCLDFRGPCPQGSLVSTEPRLVGLIWDPPSGWAPPPVKRSFSVSSPGGWTGGGGSSSSVFFFQ